MVKIEISNRAVYSLLTILIIILGTICVYAVTVPAYHNPDPGHAPSELGLPSGGCNSGDVFYWNGTQWKCKESSSSWSIHSGGTVFAPQNPPSIYEFGAVGIGSTPSAGKRLYVLGNDSDSYAVYGKNFNGNYGILGGTQGVAGFSSGGTFGYLGTSSYGVYGSGTTGVYGLGSSGSGIYGVSTSSYGGSFSGADNKGAIRLVPQQPTVIPPCESGALMYRSSTNKLYVCENTVWRKITTTA